MNMLNVLKKWEAHVKETGPLSGPELFQANAEVLNAPGFDMVARRFEIKEDRTQRHTFGAYLIGLAVNGNYSWHL